MRVGGLYRGRLWQWRRSGVGWGVKTVGGIIELPVSILLNSSNFCCCCLVTKVDQLRSESKNHSSLIKDQ